MLQEVASRRSAFRQRVRRAGGRFAPSAVVAWGLAAGLAHATVFYVDPVGGSMSNDGSQAHPWSTLQAVFAANKIESQKPAAYPYVAGNPLVAKNAGAPVKAGDTLRLLSGDHGTVETTGWYNAAMVTIEAAPGATPVLRKWSLTSGMNWTLRGLTVSAEPFGTPVKTTLINNANHGWSGPVSDIVVESCHVYTKDDIAAWTADDWNTNASSGITIAGARGVIRNNVVRNVNFGIQANGVDSLVEYNQVINFAGDGMRGLGDYSVFQYNLVKNCYNVNDNHDDGFQSWSTEGGTVGAGTRYGIVLRGNVIIQTDDLTRPHQGPLQGIGLFDGFYEDWIIENNLIVVDQYHGISLYGAIDCVIANNTVVEWVSGQNTPWIRVGDHKTRGPGWGNIVVNNIAPSYQLGSNVGGTQAANLSVTFANYTTHFVNAAAQDFRLSQASPAINAGTSVGAPPFDLEGRSRPQGPAYDVGAYEFPVPVTVAGNTADREVYSDGTMKWVGQADARIGGSKAGADGALVFVFALPELPEGETVLDAALTFRLLSYSYYFPQSNADLHGLPYRASSTVLATDFYQGAFGGDPTAYPLQDDLMVSNEPVGPISTDATGGANLAAYLAEQYAAGAQAGNCVFLRVNPDSVNVADYRYWTVATANNATVTNRPTLSILFGPGELP